MSSRQSPVSAGAEDPHHRRLMAGICLALAAMTFAVFGQTLSHGFVNFDDNVYVYENPMVARGLTLQGIAWAFSRVRVFNWHPLTWLSLMLDSQLYGLHPWGYHLSSVLIHTATVIALFLVLRNLTGALWRSAFVAAVFAIHPLRAESVAWVAERKDVLSGLFLVLTVGAYARYARRPKSWARYGLVLLLYVLGLMSKPMLVTVPVVLLLLDYWPLRREETAGWLALEKLPLLALSAACCVITFIAQRDVMESHGPFSLSGRLGNALVACVVYLRQMVWPAGLAVFYPPAAGGLPGWEVALAGLLLAGMTAVAIWQWRKRPWLLVGWLWYLVMLLPVLGFIKVGLQAYADRFTYLPQIGIYLAATWLVAQWRIDRVAFGSLMAGALAVLMVCAWKQAGYWKDSETLWTHALACTEGNFLAHYNFGIVLAEEGRTDEAMAQYKEALKIRPNYAEARNNLGLALFEEGKVDDAITQYEQVLQFQPDFADAHYNLGNALLQKGRVGEAIAQYQRALEINPDSAQTEGNLGNALRQEGRLDEAVAHYRRALQINPNNPKEENNLGYALLQKGRLAEAIVHFQKALQLNPDDATARVNLDRALARQRDGKEASH